MKNNLKFFFVALLCFTIGLTSCEKSTNTIELVDSTDLTLGEAKAEYNKLGAVGILADQNNSSKKVAADWNNLSRYELSKDRKAIYVTLNYNKATRSLLRLIIMKENGVIHSTIVEAVPNLNQYENQPIDYRKLNGKYIFYDADSKVRGIISVQNGKRLTQIANTSIAARGVSDPNGDSDGDGVVNKDDKCPDTPAGQMVNSEGCPLEVDLPEVEIPGTPGGGGTPGYPGGGGGTPGGGFPPIGPDPGEGGPGGGGTGEPGSNNTSIEVGFEGAKVDPKEENRCLDKESPGKLTIFIQQPNENTRDMRGANSVGHAFYAVTQGGITRVMGFYPNSPYAAVLTNQPSEIHNNAGTMYHVSISKDLTATQMAAVVNYANGAPSTYSLANYNCTDFAIGIAAAGGLSLPSTTGTTSIMGVLSLSSRNPGDLGQDVRAMTLPAGVTRTTTKTNAPAKEGDCPK